MAKFELVSRFAGCDELLPKRSTANSAGYDLIVAEDTIISTYEYA
jgi:dUTPase